ncbi:MAG: NUDIX hydrolase [Pseudomonadota bacterium]|nr:NUDIX hydrolase [Pseudomonadota bacterium]
MSSNLSTVPNTPVKACTILLTRDNVAGIEVFMVKRNQKIDFAYGALVFPGGKLDVQDSDPELIKFCSGEGLSIEEPAARICGIRETFEEAGILLARDANTGKMISGERCAELALSYRELLHTGSLTLLEILKKENLKLACDKLTLFARWITPKSFSRRFDAFFYLAESPVDYIASHDNTESVNSFWKAPSDVIKDADEGRATVVFATRMNLYKLSQHDNVMSLIEVTKTEEIVTVEPVLSKKGDDVTYTIPIEAGYGITQFTEYGGPSLKIKSQR